MKAIVEAFGVDYVQWRALTRACFLVDHAAVFGAYGPAASAHAIRQLVMMAFGCSLFGGAPAVFVLVGRDPLLGAALMTTTVGLVVAMTVLGQGSMIASPDDYQIVGFRPVSSRTYFFVRLTAVLGNTLGIAALVGYLPVVAFILRDRGSAAQVLAAAAAVLATSLATTFLLIGLYGWLIQIVRPSLVARVVGWVPIVVVLPFVGLWAVAAFQFIDVALPTMNIMEGYSLVSVQVPRTTWTLAVPPVWFASYVEIARGTAGAFERSAVLMSLVVLAGSLVLLRGRLSTTFARSLAQIASASSTSAAPRVARTPRWAWLRGAHRVIAIVMQAQLRDDPAFQAHVTLTVLMAAGILVSMPLFWMPTDPFLAGFSGDFLVVMAIGYLGFSFYGGLASSPAAEATWPFFTTPMARSRLILAARDISAIVVLAPAAAALLGIFLYGFGHAGHALVHAGAIAGLAFLELQFTVLLIPSVPFSVPMSLKPGPGFRQFLAGLPVLPIYFALHFAYRSWLGTAIGLAALACIIAGLEHVLRRRLAR